MRKSEIIARFGTVRNLARLIGVHPNAIRGAYSGKCPRVLEKIRGQS